MGEEREEIKKINDYPETRCGYIYMCVCQWHLREWKLGQAVWDERRNQKRLLLERTSFPRNNNKDHTDYTQISLGNHSSSLPWSSFRMTSWTSLHSVVFILGSSQHWEHLTLTLTFLQGVLFSELETIIEISSTVSVLSFTTILTAALDHFTQRNWVMTEEDLSDKCWDTIKVNGIFLTTT